MSTPPSTKPVAAMAEDEVDVLTPVTDSTSETSPSQSSNTDNKKSFFPSGFPLEGITGRPGKFFCWITLVSAVMILVLSFLTYFLLHKPELPSPDPSAGSTLLSAIPPSESSSRWPSSRAFVESTSEKSRDFCNKPFLLNQSDLLPMMRVVYDVGDMLQYIHNPDYFFKIKITLGPYEFTQRNDRLFNYVLLYLAHDTYFFCWWSSYNTTSIRFFKHGNGKKMATLKTTLHHILNARIKEGIKDIKFIKNESPHATSRFWINMSIRKEKFHVEDIVEDSKGRYKTVDHTQHMNTTWQTPFPIYYWFQFHNKDHIGRIKIDDPAALEGRLSINGSCTLWNKTSIYTR